MRTSLQQTQKRDSKKRMVVEGLERRELLTTFAVTSLADSGPGSLRQAIVDANSSPGADTIEFADGLSGEIELTSGQLSIDDDIEIVGPGADQLTISGEEATRVILERAASRFPPSRHLAGQHRRGWWP